MLAAQRPATSTIRWRSEVNDVLAAVTYVPFGGGSRICLGMRFGQLEINVIAAAILERFGLERLPRFRLEIRQTPTLGPRDGLPMLVRSRRA
ncbi:MAG: cytochrome P450 [Solirubrobacteraceae bacterium]